MRKPKTGDILYITPKYSGDTKSIIGRRLKVKSADRFGRAEPVEVLGFGFPWIRFLDGEIIIVCSECEKENCPNSLMKEEQ